eukprot:CAMPEP_0185026718 /NCGR_PEP_ID=MMETSP1103-20130426/11025_1 /TAXON_ID=36769 /ORGANISM="Paraphysomonas bandaiensis, Strain Caron Lab Isolate" /LENGTH=531 /DNA_ID=CAMNT_0027560385 /DNA_START=149 /DNA_END=1744 /DNA_ORIENTATION=-
MSFGQFAASTQFYLYGKSHCTQTGWKSASDKYPQPDIVQSADLSLNDKVYIITGANSGIGFEISSFLAKKGATLYLVCRNEERANAAKEKIVSSSNNNNIFVIICDCSLQRDVRQAWTEFEGHRSRNGLPLQLDGLLCNAGGLSNELTLTAEGLESTFAAHLLFGTYLLVNLALPVLLDTPGSRVVVVSSGGMYNTKFPEWNVATSRTGKYDGQFAYAYAKRGQVLLCERWSRTIPGVRFVSCHPGWVDTPGVTAAYGDKKKYLQPLRNLWEGSEGIIWLLIANVGEIEGGGFYLDRTPRVKHISGPFFTEGSFTKNSEREVDGMMAGLREWSTLPTDPSPSDLDRGAAAASAGSSACAESEEPLRPISNDLDLPRFMGRWYVQAHIPTFFDKGTVNNTEDYVWDEERQLVQVSFQYAVPVTDSTGTQRAGPIKEIKQHATMLSKACTEWSVAVKFLVYWPIDARSLIIGLDDDYETCMVGVPDRSALWIMTRSRNAMDEQDLRRFSEKASSQGYDAGKITRVPILDPLDP